MQKTEYEADILKKANLSPLSMLILCKSPLFLALQLIILEAVSTINEKIVLTNVMNPKKHAEAVLELLPGVELIKPPLSASL